MAVTALLQSKQGINLDLGCGTNLQPHCVGMDRRAGPDVIRHDLEEFPWPLPDECATWVHASHILEHIKPWKFFASDGGPCVMGEIWRVLLPDGQLTVAAPYGVSHAFVQDPTHCNPLNESTFTYLDPRFPLYQVYEPPFMFTIEHIRYTRVNFIHAVLRKRTVPAGSRRDDGTREGDPPLVLVKEEGE